VKGYFIASVFWQRVFIQFSIDYDIFFLNWLRTSCVVSITTVVTWHTWTADFWADFEQLKIGWMAKQLRGCVNDKRQYSNTCCNCLYRKHFIIPIETLFL